MDLIEEMVHEKTAAAPQDFTAALQDFVDLKNDSFDKDAGIIDKAVRAVKRVTPGAIPDFFKSLTGNKSVVVGHLQRTQHGATSGLSEVAGIKVAPGISNIPKTLDELRRIAKAKGATVTVGEDGAVRVSRHVAKEPGQIFSRRTFRNTDIGQRALKVDPSKIKGQYSAGGIIHGNPTKEQTKAVQQAAVETKPPAERAAAEVAIQGRKLLEVAKKHPLAAGGAIAATPYVLGGRRKRKSGVVVVNS